MSSVGTIAGSALTALGGMSGQQESVSSGSSSSTSYQKPSTYAPTAQGYLDSIPVYQTSNQKALEALQTGDASSQATLRPAIEGSYAAFDSLLDSLGISRPEEGSYKASQNKFAYDQYQAKQGATRQAGLDAAAKDMEQFDTNPGLRGKTAQADFNYQDPKAISALGDYGRVAQVYNDKNAPLAAIAAEAQHNLDQHAVNRYGDSHPDWLAAQKNAVKAYADFQRLQAPEKDVPTMTDASQQSQRIQAMLESDPNYQFQMQQGTKSIQAMSAAKGIYGDPRVAQALQTFGQGQASSAMQSYRDRLSSIIGQGMSAIGQSAQSSTNLGNLSAQAQANNGANVAGATLGATNQWQVGPVTSESNQQSSQSSRQGQTTLGQIGGIAKGLSGFLSGLS